MKETKEILKRYYQGETSLAEERMLRKARQKGENDEPMPAYIDKYTDLPADLLPQLQANLHKHRLRRMYTGWTTAASVAAMLIMVITVRGLWPTSPSDLQLSDQVKKERFEDALRTIGNVLEEEVPPLQKVVYEDQKLIIAIE